MSEPNKSRLVSAAAQAVFVLSMPKGYEQICDLPFHDEPQTPWASKYAGKPRSGSSKRASQEQSPRYVKTRHGCMKKRRK